MAAKDGEKLVGAFTSEAMAKALDKAAAAHGVSKSQLIRRALNGPLRGDKK
jgi:Ribbon-helix-helix protein, copG family